jgi:trehalose 6-phosphate synthase
LFRSRTRPLLGQLVIVSNRVAIPEKNAMARAGGLEVAVKAALKHKTGIWFGNNCPRCER